VSIPDVVTDIPSSAVPEWSASLDSMMEVYEEKAEEASRELWRTSQRWV